jgi:hypothetical protein
MTLAQTNTSLGHCLYVCFFSSVFNCEIQQISMENLRVRITSIGLWEINITKIVANCCLLYASNYHQTAMIIFPHNRLYISYPIC